jgi:flagellar hook-associated protein 3 FlgL
MRIASNTITDNMVRQIQLLAAKQSKLQNQVATGQKIAQPEDDPAATNRVLNLSNENRELAQFSRNAGRALQISEATYSGLHEIKKISDRATEIGTLGQGATSPDARTAYASELDQLIEQAIQLGNSKLGNDYLYAGTAVDQAPVVATRDAAGHVTSVTYAGNSGQISIPLSSTSSIAPQTDAATNQGITDFVNHLVALRDALNSNDSTALTTAQSNLMDTENVLVSALAAQGAVQSRIEASQSQQQSVSQNIESQISDETSADIASTMVQLTQTKTAYEAALQSTASIMKLSLLDYIN